MPPSTPTEADILKRAMSNALAGVNTAEPGVIVSYNAANQTATVQLSIKGASRDAEGVITQTARPPIPNVPICWPRSASGYGWTFPLAAGDPVLVVFASRSTDEWRTVAGTDHETRDPARRHALADAVAYPGCGSPASPMPSTCYAATAMTIGAPELRLGDSTASDFVALASLVLAELNALRAEVAAHTHPVPGVTVGAGATVSSPPIGFDPTANSVAATRVKAL